MVNRSGPRNGNMAQLELQLFSHRSRSQPGACSARHQYCECNRDLVTRRSLEQGCEKPCSSPSMRSRTGIVQRARPIHAADSVEREQGIELDMSTTIDTRGVPAMPEADFWGLISVMDHSSSARSISRLVKTLSRQEETTVYSYAETLARVWQTIREPELEEVAGLYRRPLVPKVVPLLAWLGEVQSLRRVRTQSLPSIREPLSSPADGFATVHFLLPTPQGPRSA